MLLIIDGGKIGYEEAFFDERFNRPVPMSFFGEYYLDSIAARNSTPTPIEPSPYCMRRFRRPLPTPFYDNPIETAFSLAVPSFGHTLRIVNGKPVVSSLIL